MNRRPSDFQKALLHGRPESVSYLRMVETHISTPKFELLRLLTAKPFKPFRIHVSWHNHFDVWHPHQVGFASNHCAAFAVLDHPDRREATVERYVYVAYTEMHSPAPLPDSALEVVHHPGLRSTKEPTEQGGESGQNNRGGESPKPVGPSPVRLPLLLIALLLALLLGFEVLIR